MTSRPWLNGSEKKRMVLLFLLCLLPVVGAVFSERRQAAQLLQRSVQAAPIQVSARTLAKYTGVVPLGGAGYVRLGDQGWGGGAEGEWNIYVSGHQPRPIEAHADTPRGWKVEFVEELPAWETSGVKTIGVRVTVPKGARQAIANGVTAGLFHSRDGVQLYFSDSFQVATLTTHGKSHPFNRRPGRASAGRKRANSAPPRR